MKILHTSDWHLGRSLYGRKRYEEFSAFLDWLVETIRKEQIHILLVAGDIFDTSTPGNRAQELYYSFLSQVSGTCCRHIVITGGNHDSPSFLDAPKGLLKAMNVYVTGSRTEDPGDQVLLLQKGDDPELIVCAVPYLRDRDIRTASPGETLDEKNRKLVEGVRQHYQDVCRIAQELQSRLSEEGKGLIPIAATGHLFAAGGRTLEGDGVRELYVGSLAHVGVDVFPSCIDYLALGHLHIPQAVGGREHIRYSGSPIAMGFNEASQQKKVVLIDFAGAQPDIRELPIPCFQPLVSLSGSLEGILSSLVSLKMEGSSAWVEVEYTGTEVVPNLRDLLEETLDGGDLEILRIKNRRVMEGIIRRASHEETLDDLDVKDVFQRCLDAYEVPEGEREELDASYNEIILSLQEDDRNAE